MLEATISISYIGQGLLSFTHIYVSFHPLPQIRLPILQLLSAPSLFIGHSAVKKLSGPQSAQNRVFKNTLSLMGSIP